MFGYIVMNKPEIKMKYVYYYDRGYSPSLDRLFPNLSDRERMLELAPRYNMDSTDFKTPEEMKQIILEENGVNLDSISGRKKIFIKTYVAI